MKSPGLFPPLIILAAFFLPQPEAITRKADPSVLVENEISLGSGTHIGDGVILTAAHVVAKGGTIEVKDRDGNTYIASVSFIDRKSDVATLQIATNAPIQKAPVSCREPMVGEPIFTIGNPMGVLFLSIQGYVAGETRVFDNGMTIFPTDMTTIPGMSGGSVRDWWGNVIGIVSMVMIQPMFGTPLAIGYSVPSSAFCPLLKQAGVM